MTFGQKCSIIVVKVNSVFQYKRWGSAMVQVYHPLEETLDRCVVYVDKLSGNGWLMVWHIKEYAH